MVGRKTRNSSSNVEERKPERNSARKSVDFTRYVSSTWKGNVQESTSGFDSAKSSKSVTFTADEDVTQAMLPEVEKDSRLVKTTALSGLLVEPLTSSTAEAESDKRKGHSLSQKLPIKWPGAQHTSSEASMDDRDLWLKFLMDTGLIRISEPNVATSDFSDIRGRHDTRVDDPNFIIQQLSYYKNIPNHNVYDYEEIHRNTPGLFWDTVTMDDRDVAFNKMKNIIKNIVKSQKSLTPMFEIDFANISAYPTVQKKLKNIRNQIAPQRLFY